MRVLGMREVLGSLEVLPAALYRVLHLLGLLLLSLHRGSQLYTFLS